MKTILITRWKVLIPIFLWWLIFLTLSLFNFNYFQLINIFGFLFLIIAPGLLTLLSMNFKGVGFWGYLGLTVALSLLELMLFGLLGNTLLPFAGIARPLDKLPLLIEFYPLIAVLAVMVWLSMEDVKLTIKKCFIFDNLRDHIFAFFPIIFVVLSIFGTIHLNDGGSGILTMFMLGGMAIYLGFLIFYAKELDENTIPTAIFFMSLALLFMTSLRGWYVTGHDIQSEYKVFELAKSSGLWNIAAYQDAYNACLSITILPTIFSNLLSVPDPYIYKIFFQIIFAIAPTTVYLISRNWTNRTISLLATIFFISFPTFFTDMPFLNRQEIAFLYYGLMLYIIFNEKLLLSTRRFLFMLMGIGVILSHYSTTYTILVIFGCAVISRPLFIKIIDWLKKKPFFKNSALIPSGGGKIGSAKITVLMIGSLLLLSFLWTSIITNTGSSVTSVLSQTFSAVKDGFTGDNRSIDATSLLSFGSPSQTQELEDYITKVADPIRGAGIPGEYYDESTYDRYYPLTALNNEVMPITKFGELIQHLGIDPGTLMTIFGQLLAKFLEILVPLGMIYLLFNNSFIERVDDELYMIAFYCLIFIALNIILPVLSTDYGIYRAMQQSMFVIAPIIVAGSVMIGNALIKLIKIKWSGEIFAIILTMTFFLYSTSFLRQLLGDNVAVLYLSNTGQYYDNYLIQTTEVYGVEWLTNVADADSNSASGIRLDIQTDRYSDVKFASLTPLDAYDDILPSVVRKNGYVFLGPEIVTKDRATVIYNGDQVSYQYPMLFLQDNKDLIYTNGGSDVYR